MKIDMNELTSQAAALVGKLTHAETAALAAHCLELLPESERFAVANHSFDELEKEELAEIWGGSGP